MQRDKLDSSTEEEEEEEEEEENRKYRRKKKEKTESNSKKAEIRRIQSCDWMISESLKVLKISGVLILLVVESN